MTTTTTVERLADAISAAAPQVDEAGRQIALALWDLLAGSRPPGAVKVKRRSLPREVLPTTTGGLRREEESSAQRRAGSRH